MSRRRDPDARRTVRPGAWKKATEAFLRERAWTVDVHDDTPDTLTVEAAADDLKDRLGE